MLRLSLVACLMIIAGCKNAVGETCKTTSECDDGLACKDRICHDPTQYCRAGRLAAACRDEGRCQLVGEECLPASEEDCKKAARCKEYGACNLADGCCSVDDQCRPVEEDPITHLERLGDASQRDAALDKIDALYQSAVSLDDGDPQGKHTKPLLDQIVPPLSAIASRAKLPPERQATVVSILARSRHPKAIDALVDVLRLHRVDNASATPLDAAMSEVLVAVADLEVGKAAPHVLSLFLATHASTPKGEVNGFARNLERALIVLADRAWEPQLLERLEPRLDSRGDLRKWRDQVYWQQAAARALGRIRSATAVEPLLKVALSPRKADIFDAVVEALVAIGPKAGALAAQVLSGEHKELVDYAKQEHEHAVDADVGDVGERSAEAYKNEVAAVILARLGRSEHAAEVLGAIDAADELGRARIAMALPSLPPGEAVIAAFKSTYERSPLDLPVHKRYTGVAALMDVAPQFLDPALTPWIVDTAVKLQGTDTGLAPFREAALLSAMKLMTQDQRAKVEELGRLVTEDKWRKDFDLGTALLAKCEQKAGCYLEALAADERDIFEGIKAASMAGIYAKADDRAALVKALLAEKELDVQRVLALAIDRVTPKGDLALAGDIEQKLKSAALADPTIAMILGRLRARAS